MEVLPGPGAFCSSSPGKACQIVSVLICHLLLHSSSSDFPGVAGEHTANLLASNGQSLCSSADFRHMQAPFLPPLGMILICLSRLVPYTQHSDPIWHDMLWAVSWCEALQAVGWGYTMRY